MAAPPNVNQCKIIQKDHSTSSLPPTLSSACASWLWLHPALQVWWEKRDGGEQPAVCIIHPVSIKPGPRPHFFDNNLCSFVNSSWSSCTGLDAATTVAAFLPQFCFSCLKMTQIHNSNDQNKFLLYYSAVWQRFRYGLVFQKLKKLNVGTISFRSKHIYSSLYACQWQDD